METPVARNSIRGVGVIVNPPQQHYQAQHPASKATPLALNKGFSPVALLYGLSLVLET